MKKRVLVTVLAAAMFAMTVAGCGQTEAKEVKESQTDIDFSTDLMTEGVLTVGMEVGYPPFEDYAADGVTPIGFDIDMADAIAEYLGVEVKYIDTAFDGIMDGLKADKYDVIISGYTINAERAAAANFTTAYVQNYQSLVVKKGSGVTATDISQVSGLRVGYQAATTSEEYFSALLSSGEVTAETFEYDKIIDCFSDLVNGRIDIILCDSTVANGYVQGDPDTYEIVWVQEDAPEEFGIAVKQEDTNLLNAINEALSHLEENGTMETIRSTWLY